MNVPTVVITHHTGGSDAYPLADTSYATVNDVNIWHKSRWPEFKSRRGYWVGYHYVIERDGTTTQTRDHNEEGAHVIGMNTKSIGVCFAGNFDVTLPTEQQMKAWYKLYTKLQQEYPNIPTYPHRKYATKTCHGKLLKDEHFAIQYKIASLQERIDMLKALLQQLLSNRRMK
jgi:hypothetical protein